MSVEPERQLWFLEEADDDVTVAFRWYESQRGALGEEFVTALDAALEPLLRFPESGEVFYRETRAASASGSVRGVLSFGR